MKHGGHRGHGGHGAKPRWGDAVPSNVNDTVTRVLDAAFLVHTELGPGLLESVYEVCLAHALTRLGARVARQVYAPVTFQGLVLPTALRLDLLVDDLVVVELEAVEEVTALHRAQLLSYLRLTGSRLGLLINFNTVHLRDGIQRVIR